MKQIMKRTYRWGILGAGRIAEKFASALTFTEGAEVFAVASRDGNKAGQFAQKYGAGRVYDQYLKLAQDPEVDIIYIATPHAFHCKQALLCLENKKPVLCEKPMALSSGQVRQMINSSRSNQTFLMEGMWSRFMPSFNKALEIITGGMVGRVQYLQADFGFQAAYDPEGRLYNIKLGGGSLLDVGIYPLFLATLLFGEPGRIQALARLSQTGADEYCSMQFQYSGGQVANIFSGISFKTSLSAEIAGARGRIYLHPPFYKATRLTLELDTGEINEYSFPYEHNGFEYEIREVMQCLDRGDIESPLMTHEFSLSMARTLDVVKEQCGIVYDEECGN